MATCENHPKKHTCRGPLYLVEENNEEKVLCFESVKKLILTGHDIDIIENLPRSMPKKGKFIPDYGDF